MDGWGWELGVFFKGVFFGVFFKGVFFKFNLQKFIKISFFQFQTDKIGLFIYCELLLLKEIREVC